MAFDENIIYNFTNNPGDYEQDGTANPGVLVDTISDDPDLDNIFVVSKKVGTNMRTPSLV